MSKRIIAGWLILASCAEGGGVLAPPEPNEVLYGTVRKRDMSGVAEGADFTALIAAQNTLATELFKKIGAAGPDASFAIGSYSVHQVLGMLAAGARGKTADDLSGVLGASIPRERLHATINALDLEMRSRGKDVTLALANRIWGQRGLPVLPDFLDVLTKHYGAPMAVTDFAEPEAARAEINDWVFRATSEIIRELMPAGTIDPTTRVVLVNGLYMHAPWKYPFDPERSRLNTFTRLDGSTAQVPMMHFDEFLPSAGAPGWQAVELPYRGDELSMVFIEPDDFRAFEAAVDAELLDTVFAALRHDGIHLSLPKFELSHHASLVPALRELGLGSLFDGADLSGIVAGGGLQVAHIEHEVFVKVNEEGTEAAAATGASIAASHGPTIAIDRPFLFVIRDRPTGTILFLGRVLDPGTVQ